MAREKRWSISEIDQVEVYELFFFVAKKIYKKMNDILSMDSGVLRID